MVQGVLVGVHAPRQFDGVALDADGLQASCGFAFGGFPGLVGVEGEAHAFDFGGADRLEELGGEVGGAEGAGGGRPCP